MYNEKWQQWVASLREISPSLGAILSNSNITKENDKQVEIDVFSPFHKTQLELPKFNDMLKQAAQSAGLPFKSLSFTASKTTTIVSEVQADELTNAAVQEVMELLT